MVEALTEGAAAPDARAWLPALMIAVGLVGIILPVLPGLLLVLGGVLVWALMVGSAAAWVVLSVCVVLYAGAVTAQILIPGRRLKRQGLRTPTLVLAGVAGVVGFFVVPVVGLPLFFLGAVWLVELARHRSLALAWTRTRQAVLAVVQSIWIELSAGLLIAVLWATSAVAL